MTTGTYYNAQNEEDLRGIYDELDPEFVIRTETMEVTALFAAAAILVFLLGSGFSLVWFSRLP
ncbi:MAG: hypothetical protein R2932_35960 [Caldilineaceae bacterium]